MIKAQVSGVSDILKEFKQLADTNTIARMVNRDIAPPIERRLDQVAKTVAPARSNIKFIWSLNRAANIRARRWWFAALARGEINSDGSHYIRTGTIPNSWQTEIFIQGDEIVLSIFNPAPGSEFLYGSPTQTQVPGHVTTGWLNYQDLLDFTDVVRSETAIAWEQLIINTTKAVRK